MLQGQQVFFSDQRLNDQSNNSGQTNTHFIHNFKTFINDFRRENVRIYYRQIQHSIQQNKYYITVLLADLKAFNENLYEKLIANPLQTLELMDISIKNYVKEKSQELSTKHNLDADWHVMITSDEIPRVLRDINSSYVNKIITVNGIIISASKPFIKASTLKIQCKSCQTVKYIRLQPGQQPIIPSYCRGQPGNGQKCPTDSFVACPDSQFIDTQHLRIQQNPEQVPTGQIARTFNLVSDRYNVNRCVPGDRVKITGILIVNRIKADHLSKGALLITGVEKLKDRATIHYTQQDEEKFKKMSKDPKIYEKIYKSIAPGISGNEDIKKGIACMLFGGSRKHLPDSTILRGDINILLMGDPSTAKSQFLKFVESTASIAVYTSGKGSSAAGLTASITKDSATGQFQIEGGALVLADGGIVCIDQFDKMKPADRVAIHEAMQQQTISIAKAGITTRLHSRTSILAAANPVNGFIDDTRQIVDQVSLQNTILSRFDCIFIVRDINTDENNKKVAQHILNLHQGRLTKEQNSDIQFKELKKYIGYAKNKISPRLSSFACQKLINSYAKDRKTQSERRGSNSTHKSFPITVRQLEAVIRLSQAIAKMKLKSQVDGEDVDEAHYLFQVSTMKAVESEKFGYKMTFQPESIQKVQDAIKKRVYIGSQTSVAALQESCERYNPSLFQQALAALIQKGEFKSINKNKYVLRQK